MKKSVSLLILFGLLVLSALACAKPVEEPPLPAHPYPRWVNALESGKTQLEDVQTRFGEPNEVEQGPRGEKIWRYVYREIAWPDKDPMRPVVAADGSIHDREPTAVGRFAKRVAVVTDWFDRAMYFPPRQDRLPRKRRLPATVHQLEVVFGSDGTLRRFRYSPQPGYASVAVTH